MNTFDFQTLGKTENGRLVIVKTLPLLVNLFFFFFPLLCSEERHFLALFSDVPSDSLFVYRTQLFDEL